MRNMSKVSEVVKLTRGEICRHFQLSGITMKSEALTLIERELARHPYESITDFIAKLSHVMTLHVNPESHIVDAAVVKTALEKLSKVDKSLLDRILIKNTVTSETDSKASNFVQHYNELFKNVNSHDLFAKNSNFKLTTVDALNTCDTVLNDCIVFGYLRRNPSKISGFILEDAVSKVPVDLGNADWRDGLMVLNSFVLIEGSYDSERDILEVNAIGLPPMLPSTEEVEESDSNKMMVMLHDIHLDDHETLERLRTLLTGYNSVEVVPDCFIFVGNFVSERCTNQNDFKAYMRNFVKMISAFPNLASESHFVFVPGENDFREEGVPKTPFSSDWFPITRIQNISLVSNPVSIYTGGLHMCIFGYDYVHKIKQKKAIIYDNTEEPEEFGAALGKLLVTNCHLTTGLNRDYNSALSLWHPPSLLVLADKSLRSGFDCKLFENRTNFINLPSFSQNQYKFKVFYTGNRQLEDSQIFV